MSIFNPLVEFDLEQEAYDPGTLCCPGCGSIWLHHGSTRVHNRPVEDADTISTLVRRNGDINVRADKNDENPSSRRSGISIYFRCEFCELKSELTIAQYKGQTQVRWREASPRVKNDETGEYDYAY